MKQTIAMTIVFVMALSWHMPAFGERKEDPADPQKNDLTISLITCYPGAEIYELCGHSAIRVRGEGIDSVWNFGIFDFNQPNFVYRFVKGETDYKGASYPFRWFMPEYINSGRKVVEQDLNFTPEETERLYGILKDAVLPENAVYRYNYVKDNCSIRILNDIDSAALVEIIYPDSVRYGTFRNEMRSYHDGYPWYQFGIDLALGSGLDYKIGSREEMFVPVEMMRNVASARFEDGRPLVKATRILNQGTENAVLPPTTWYLGPVFLSWLFTLLVGCIITWNMVSRKLFLPIYIVWFFILGLAGCLISFLVFISVHEATNPNILIFWLNPFQFLFVLGMVAKPLRILAKIMAFYNIIVVGVMLVISPFINQSLNPAFFPLMLSTVVLAGTYAILTNITSYKIR